MFVIYFVGSAYQKLTVANRSRYGALRLVSVEQGYDPRDFSLVAFGGAGPLHANSIGKLLGTFPVIIPPSPGVLCALGEATTLLRYEVGKPLIRVLSNVKKEEIVESYRSILTQAKEIMCNEQSVPVASQVASSISLNPCFKITRFT